jgi:hypothetical protein
MSQDRQPMSTDPYMNSRVLLVDLMRTLNDPTAPFRVTIAALAQIADRAEGELSRTYREWLEELRAAATAEQSSQQLFEHATAVWYTRRVRDAFQIATSRAFAAMARVKLGDNLGAAKECAMAVHLLLGFNLECHLINKHELSQVIQRVLPEVNLPEWLRDRPGS